MTMQASEIIQYRGEQYSLFANPLYSYLETRKDISFDMYTTAHWRGYQGYWKLENDNLYIIAIESAKHTIQTIFQTSDPVFANWFSGTIEIGFGEVEYAEWNTIYENYLWLKIEGGKVTDKKVVKQIDHNPTINFGKYKGKTISDVLKGKINTSFNREFLCKEYVAEVINFFCNKDYYNKINVPHFDVTEDTKSTADEIKHTTVKYLLTSKFVAIEKHFYINSTGEEDTEKFSKVLEEMLTSDFILSRTLVKKDFPDADIAESTFLLNNDIHYLEWAINKVENFSISPRAITEIGVQKYLRRFEINRLNSTIFEYKPVIEEIVIELNAETKKINLIKFQNQFAVIYDFENNIYVHDLPKEQLYDKFGYFLDESYQLTIDDEDYDQMEMNYENHEHNDYERDYFHAMTDGQLGNYDDFIDNGGNIDDIDTWSRG